MFDVWVLILINRNFDW